MSVVGTGEPPPVAGWDVNGCCRFHITVAPFISGSVLGVPAAVVQCYSVACLLLMNST